MLWRLAALYALFRWVVRTPAQVRTCLWILLATAVSLALIALAQSVGNIRLGGPWAPTAAGGDQTGRGATTLNSPIATGDFLAYSLGIALDLVLASSRAAPHHRRGRRRSSSPVRSAPASSRPGSRVLIIVGFIVVYEGQLRRLFVWFIPLTVVRGRCRVAGDRDPALGLRRLLGHPTELARTHRQPHELLHPDA